MNPKFHRYALLLALSSLVLITIGAFITSHASGRQLAWRGVLDGVLHRYIAVGLGVLALVFAIWLLLEEERCILGWICVSLVALEGWVGWLGAPVLHASLAPLEFAIFIALALLTSPGWNETSHHLVKRQNATTLQWFAIGTPPLILMQITLGAAYRHKLIGLIPHLGGAMIVSLATLLLGTLVVQRHPEHRPLRASAIWLLSIFVAAVMLGFGALLIPLLNLTNPAAEIAVTASHVAVSSLALAASVVLAIHLQRGVRPAAPGFRDIALGLFRSFNIRHVMPASSPSGGTFSDKIGIDQMAEPRRTPPWWIWLLLLLPAPWPGASPWRFFAGLFFLSLGILAYLLWVELSRREKAG